MSAGDIVRFIRTWGTTGAIAPSGRALARRLTDHVDASSNETVLELGPGTGVVTRALIERGIAPERIIAVEFNPDFCRILSTRYPRIQVVHGDAYDLSKALDGRYEGSFNAAVSSLPLLLRPPSERRALVLDVLSRLAPGGALAQFSYSPKPPVPSSSDAYSLVGSGWIFMNMPPARVWTYRSVDA
jgi:phosphatidylethanolamine/phosphatidyl-N-methylethanolamine N-methyltransferase